jgi:transketolase C-terminal domain/subunit
LRPSADGAKNLRSGNDPAGAAMTARTAVATAAAIFLCVFDAIRNDCALCDIEGRLVLTNGARDQQRDL